MAGAMRRMGEYLGLVEQAEYDEAAEYETPAPARTATAVRTPAPQQQQPAARPVTALEDRRQPGMSVADLARIETVTPRTYNDARTIGESFRSGVPVIMNLSDIGDDDAKRLVDFAAGLVFAVHGTINRITAKVFLLSPEGVQVSDEDRATLAAGGFYNQS
ncbi:cell division protein SepF [Aeromicrobium sp.]|uniref:cell division protein SepF n=1 Tax=Aeromicrobium sp. TaxID=1871063 RepID=UPI0028AC2B24|nr:cell division protein SepF [Aeromicrobium sp.]